MAANDEILGIGGHFDISDIQRSFDELVKGFGKLSNISSETSAKIEKACKDVATASQENIAKRSKHALDVLSQAFKEAKQNADKNIEKIGGTLDRLQKRLDKVTAERMDVVIGSKKWNTMSQEIKSLNAQIEAQQKYLEEARAESERIAQNSQVTLNTINQINQASAHAKIKDAVKEEAAAHEKNTKAIQAETQANKENEAGIDSLIKKARTFVAGLVAMEGVQRFKDLGVQVAKVRGEFQDLETAFKTMLGDEQKANALMQEITTTAAKTHFDLQQVAQGAKQLLAYGEASDKVNDTLVRLGNISAGLTIPLNDLVYLYGTTMTQGRLFTQDLRQFMGRGIPIAEELAKQFGVTKDEVGELVTAGKVGFAEVEAAIVSLTSKGGKFSGLMEQQSKNINGQISNLEDQFVSFLNELGEKNEDIINGVLGIAGDLLENYETIGKTIATVIAVYGTYKAALMLQVGVTRALMKVERLAVIERIAAVEAGKNLTNMQLRQVAVTKMLQTAQKNLIATMRGAGVALMNPYVLATAAVVGLTFAIYKAVTAETEHEKAVARLSESTAELNKNYANEKYNVDELFESLKKAKQGTQEHEKAKQEIINQYGSYLSKLGDEREALNDIALAYKTITEEIWKSSKAKMKAKLWQDEGETRMEREKDDRENLLGVVQELYRNAPPAKAEKEFMNIVKRIEGGRDRSNGKWINELAAIDNELATSVNNLLKSREQYEDNIKLYEKIYGDVADDEQTQQEIVVNGIRRNKKYWEELRKSKQEEFDALTEAQAKSERGRALLKEIQEADKHLATWSGGGKTTSTKQGETTEAIKIDKAAGVSVLAGGENKDALREYLKAYGNYQQQKLAIAEEYAQRIASANTAAERAGLYLQQEDETRKLQQANFTNDIDWYGIFSDLQGHTKDYLQGLKMQLVEVMANNSLEPEQMAVAQEKLNALNEELSKQGGLFDFIGSRQREYNRLLEESAAAQESLAAAEQREQSLKMQLEFKKATLSKTDKNSAAYRDIQTDILVLENKLAEARKNTAKATNEAIQAEDRTKRSAADALAAWFADAQEYITKKGIDQIPDLLNSIGLGSLGERAAKGLSAFNNASGAAAAFASGNYIGAALKGINAIKDFGGMLGFGGGNAAEVEAAINRLTDRNETLTDAIDSLTEEMETNRGMLTVSQAKEAVEYQKQKESNLQEIAKEQSGYHNAHHSWNYYWDGFSKEFVKEFSKRIGRSWSGDIWELTAEEMKQLLEIPYAEELIKGTGEGGYGDRVFERLEDYADEAGKIEDITEQLNETLTGMTFEGMYSSFIDSLLDMKKSAKDITNEMSKYFQRSMLEYSIGEVLYEDLKAWREKYAKYSEEGLNEDELKELNDEYARLVEEGVRQRDEVMRAMGGSFSYQDADAAASRSIKSITSEQANEIDGRLTAMQIAQQISIEQRTAILETLAPMQVDMRSITDNVGNISANIAALREVQFDCLHHLSKISEHTSNLTTYLPEMARDISVIKQQTE